MNDIRRMLVRQFFQTADDDVWRRRTRYVFLVGLVLRVSMTFIVVGGMQQMGDGPAYVRQAMQILSGAVDHYYFPPGTALFTIPVFGLLGFSTVTEHIAGLLISIAFLGGTALLAQTVLSSSRAVFLATLLASTYPHVVLSSAQISSLPLTAALVSVAVAACLRARSGAMFWWMISGTACALAIIVRPGSVLLPVVLGVWFVVNSFRDGWAMGRLTGRILVFVGIIVLFCLPIMSFHAARGHGWTIATNSEWNLLLANNAYTPDYKTGHFGQRAIADLPLATQKYIRQFFTTETAETATRDQRVRMADSAKSYILAHPWRTLWRISNRARGFFGCDYTAAREMQLVFGYSDATFGLVMAVEAGVYLFVLAGWCLFFIGGPFNHGISRLLSGGILVAIMAPHLAAFALAKYHLPVVPLMICATASIVDESLVRDSRLIDTLKKRRNILIIMAIAALVLQAEHLYHLVILR